MQRRKFKQTKAHIRKNRVGERNEQEKRGRKPPPKKWRSSLLQSNARKPLAKGHLRTHSHRPHSQRQESGVARPNWTTSNENGAFLAKSRPRNPGFEQKCL